MRPDTPTIDGHRHILCPEAHEAASKLNRSRSNNYVGHAASAAVNLERSIDWNRKMSDAEESFADLASAGMDMAVLQPPPIGFYYWAEPSAGAELARMVNENTARWVRERPERFLGLAALPLQSVESALTEFDYAVLKLGLKGAAVTSNINGLGLDDKGFLPFFEKAAALDVPIFIHPDNAAGAERMRNYYLVNFLGYPLDTTIAAASLVYGGVLDRFPTLKICLAHAGGVLPFLLGRLEHGRAVRPEASGTEHPFPHYLKNFYVDSITFSAQTLRFVLSVMPEGHVFVGTDYPFDMGDLEAAASVKEAVKEAEGLASILGGTIERLMGLERRG